MATYTSDTPYSGPENIIISIDIGTTHTAATFSHVRPGAKPDVRSVLNWPGQADAAGNSKIPTIIAYQEGEAKLCGAEAIDYLEDDEYQVARWFKLYLHADSMTISDLPPAYGSDDDSPAVFEIPPLPTDVTLQKVYVDFMKYVWKVIGDYFVERTPNGQEIWDRYLNKSVIVLCVPNGWDIAQHTFLRTAAIQAKLVSESDADARLEFITEAEASVHFALAYTNGSDWLSKGTMFVATDAGGSTVDSTLYECKSTDPLVLEEVCASRCIQAGGVFVDRAVQTTLESKLEHSQYGSQDCITAMVRAFERKTKRAFDGTQDLNVIAFGRAGDNDRSKGIIKGKMSLTQREMKDVFTGVIERTVSSCLDLLRGQKIQYLLLVGGFAESPFLRSRLGEEFRDQGTNLVTVAEPSKKAAAEGATIWFIKQLVKARAARCTYGIQASTRYKSRVHRERKQQAQAGTDGVTRIQIFDPIIQKDAVLSDHWEKVTDYCFKYKAIPTSLGCMSIDVFVWEGEGATIWTRDTEGELLPGMRCLCMIKADMSSLQQSLIKKTSTNNSDYWQLTFQVVMTLNRTRLQAKLRWTENDQLREGPVTIIPQSTFQQSDVGVSWWRKLGSWNRGA